MSQFAKRFRKLYEEGSLTQTEVSEKIFHATGVRIPQTTLSGYLNVNDPKEPGVYAASAIARTYRVSIEWLCGDTDKPTTVPDMLNRLSELSFDKNIIKAAHLLTAMPETERAEALSYISAKYEQWKMLSSLVRIIQKFDADGTLRERVAALSGLDASRIDAISDFHRNNMLGNGDANSIGQEEPLTV